MYLRGNQKKFDGSVCLGVGINFLCKSAGSTCRVACPRNG